MRREGSVSSIGRGPQRKQGIEAMLDRPLLARRAPGNASWRDELILLFPAVFIFAVVSSKTGFSEHLRYVLPAFPYFFIWISQLARIFNSQKNISA